MIQAQAWICPICKDDHSMYKPCPQCETCDGSGMFVDLCECCEIHCGCYEWGQSDMPELKRYDETGGQSGWARNKGEPSE